MEQPKDVWEVGESYELFMGRWSRLVAEEFLVWLSVPAGSSWLDVGCGTGTLSRTILEVAEPSRMKGKDQAPGFIAFAKSRIRDPRAAFEVGKAESLDAEEVRYDAVVSGLVLNFVPDPGRAVRAMQRLTNPGGVVAAYVWDYADMMEFLRHFWNAATGLDPGAAGLDEGKRFPLCDPESLRRLFVAQGLHGVEVRAIDVRTQFADFQDYWMPFLSGQGPAPSYVASLSPEQQFRLQETVRSSLPVSSEGSIELTARAWAVRGYHGQIVTP